MCAYDGLSRENEKVVSFCRDKNVVQVCPEMLGGLGCPRERHEISGGDGKDVLAGRSLVVSVAGENRTQQFLKGAEETLRIAQQNNCSLAILKENSPSCGVNRIHSGKFNSVTIPGPGVTTAILKASNIQVIPETKIT